MSKKKVPTNVPDDPTTEVDESVKEIETPETVRVYKVQNDAQIFFCGEGVRVDKEGREYFDLPSHAKTLVDQHINLTWPEGE